MAKKSLVQRNLKRRRMNNSYAKKRMALMAIAKDKSKPNEERFNARLKMAELPRNSAASRIRNRCAITGRSRGYYRKLDMSRIMLRELASKGYIPGMMKSSW